jgi:hypothetical protein
MAAIHLALMKYMGQVADQRGMDLKDQELAVNMATKLARTFSAQLEALKRYRGNQNLTVRHVLVNEGERVGNDRNIADARSRRAALKESSQTPALTDSRQAPMESLENEKEAWLEHVRRKEASS